jgi:hypothetical protein
VARLTCAALALIVLAPAQASAFVQAQTMGARAFPTVWQESCAPITIYVGDFEAKAHLTTASIVKSVVAAAHAWSPDAVTCEDGVSHPSFEIVPSLAPIGAAEPAIGDDARNVVVFRTESWTMDGTVGDMALDPEALARTVVTVRPGGQIVDADILVNGVSVRWKDFDPGVSPSPDQGETVREYDLQAALTHEFGHFLGFAHTCVQDGEPAAKDDRGRDVPSCNFPPEDVIRSVMFFKTKEDDPTKRVLSPDDERAVCQVYRSDTNRCAVDVASDGCAVAPARGGALAGGAAVAGLIAAWLRRRARA